MIWFTSDLHYFHNNIIEFSGRPYVTMDEMIADFIFKHNHKVSDSDEVWMLGDISFGNPSKTMDVLRSLNGRINLVLGNHDKHIEKHPGHYIPDIFESVQHYKEINYKDQKIILSHFAMRVWNQSHHGSWMLHGHSHGTLEPHGLSVDVGVDSPYVLGKPSYRPLSFDEISEFMTKRKRAIVDHHNEKTGK